MTAVLADALDPRTVVLTEDFEPTLDQTARAGRPLSVTLTRPVLDAVRACHEFALRRITDGGAVYGATTGLGPMVIYPGQQDPADQCRNVLGHLGAGQGPELDADVVRAAMLVRLSTLCRAHSGVSVRVVEALAAALRTDFTPAVPRLGSLGASGDLIPLSYVARALQGEGFAFVDGIRMPSADALRLAGLSPLELDGRDALALVNGTSLTAAAAALTVRSLRTSTRGALRLSALQADLLGSTTAHLEPELLAAFGHPGTAAAGATLRTLMDGGGTGAGRPLQEPYSIRCTPQLIGAAHDALEYAEKVVTTDLRSVSDNPLFFPDSDVVAHGGNFFGQPVAFAADLMNIVAVQLGNLAERQLDLLIDPHRNGGLPPMLANVPGCQHGVQGVQLAATAIVASMRRTATPASMQSLPTNWHNQDVIPFGTQAALGALDQARLLRLLHGSLALALRQAAYVSGRKPSSPASTELLGSLAEAVAPIDFDRPLDNEVRKAADVLDELCAR